MSSPKIYFQLGSERRQIRPRDMDTLSVIKLLAYDQIEVRLIKTGVNPRPMFAQKHLEIPGR